MRSNGMSLGPIPFDKMHWYADEELGLDEDERRAFVWVIRRTDGHFLAFMAKSAKSDK